MHISSCWNEILFDLNFLKFCSFWNKIQNCPSVRQLYVYIWMKYTLGYGLLSLISLTDTDSRDMARFMPASSPPSGENLVYTFWPDVEHKKVHISVLLILAECHSLFSNMNFFFGTDYPGFWNWEPEKKKPEKMVNLWPMVYPNREIKLHLGYWKRSWCHLGHDLLS